MECAFAVGGGLCSTTACIGLQHLVGIAAGNRAAAACKVNDDMDLEWLFDRCSPEPNSGCWLWTLSLKGGGYAQVGYGDRTSVTAHKLAYQFKHGATPNGLELDHLCRVRCCINPDHLEPVTHRVNGVRGEGGRLQAIENLAKTHCKRGHPYADDNLYVARNSNGNPSRVCRACQAIAQQRYRRRAGR